MRFGMDRAEQTTRRDAEAAAVEHMAMEAVPQRQTSIPARRPWYTILYVQVLIAIALGVAVGHYNPTLGVALKPLGDGFIALIKMMIAPVIFCTIVHGIAGTGNLKKLGRVGGKALLYLVVVRSLALWGLFRARPES